MAVRQKWIQLLLLVLFIAILAACGNGNEQAEQPDGNAGHVGGNENAANEDSNEPVKPVVPETGKIVFFTEVGDSEESFDYRFGDMLRKRFPEMEIVYHVKQQGQHIAEVISTGVEFDIYFSSIGNFENSAFTYDLATDMTPLIEKHDVDLSAVEPTIIEAIKRAGNGELYALPVQNNNLVLYYNKDIFDRFGEEYPVDGMTWDETLELANRLTRINEDVPYFGFTHSHAHTVRLNPLSIPNANLETNKPTIATDDRWNKFFQTFFITPTSNQVYQDYMKQTNKSPDMNNFVKEQNVAMFAYLASWMNVWEDQLKQVNWDMAALPSFADNPGVGSPSYPGLFGITTMAKNPDTAMIVLEYMISDEFQAELARKGTMPVLQTKSVQEAFGEYSPFKDKHLQAVYYNKFAPITEKAPYDANLVNVYRSTGIQLQLGTKDINTALREASEQAEQVIAEYLKGIK